MKAIVAWLAISIVAASLPSHAASGTSKPSSKLAAKVKGTDKPYWGSFEVTASRNSSGTSGGSVTAKKTTANDLSGAVFCFDRDGPYFKFGWKLAGFKKNIYAVIKVDAGEIRISPKAELGDESTDCAQITQKIIDSDSSDWHLLSPGMFSYE